MITPDPVPPPDCPCSLIVTTLGSTLSAAALTLPEAAAAGRVATELGDVAPTVTVDEWCDSPTCTPIAAPVPPAAAATTASTATAPTNRRFPRDPRAPDAPMGAPGDGAGLGSGRFGGAEPNASCAADAGAGCHASAVSSAAGAGADAGFHGSEPWDASPSNIVMVRSSRWKLRTG